MHQEMLAQKKSKNGLNSNVAKQKLFN